MKSLKDIHDAARADGIPIMKDDGIEFLKQYIKEHPEIQKILEIGTAVGYSAIQMASVREDIVIDTVEIDPACVTAAIQNISDQHLSDRIYIHQCDGADYVTMAVYDLIFIDAAKSQYGRYLEHYMDNSHEGTVFIFDNLAFHGIVDNNELSQNRSTVQMAHKILKFRNDLLKDERFDSIYYPDKGDGIAVAVRK
ncbi:MAG: methyltransferase [Erysipelotrichaceae bacterium]|nr:methyltransferase [Erysipelotrichaceae bacterium]